ncbi:MAG: PPC domain-containing protein, partial [Planctomycetes bacterium]|nr:PPC domain-containing protein [Planctomycetota bacterium]
KSSGMATAVIGRWDEVLEAEPNDTPEAATKVTIPCVVNGRLAKVKDRDFYQFDAKKGQQVVIRGVTRSLGSPSDLFMRLHAADGKKLAEVEDTNLDEGQLSFTFPADGTYRLMVEDVTRRGGSAHAYRVEIGAVPTGFTLRVPAGKNATDRFTSPAGGVTRIPVECVRTGYNGPITLSLVGAAKGTELYNNVIPQGGKNVSLWLSLPAEAKQGDFRSLRIVGTATIDGKQITAAVGTEALLRAKWPQMTTIPASLSGSLAVVVGPAVKPLFEISVSPKQIQFARTLAVGQFKVPLKRLNKEFKEPLQVVLEGLPAGVTYKVSKQGKGKDEHYRVDLAGPKDIAEGEHKIRVIGLGAAKGQGYRVVLADVAFRTVTPLSVTVAPAGPIAPGKKQKVKVSLTTAAADGAKPQAVVLSFKGLPAGVTGPGQIAITAGAGKVELEVELSAAADAKVGKFDGLIVVAQTKYLGKDVSLESPAVQLEVKK